MPNKSQLSLSRKTIKFSLITSSTRRAAKVTPRAVNLTISRSLRIPTNTPPDCTRTQLFRAEVEAFISAIASVKSISGLTAIGFGSMTSASSEEEPGGEYIVVRLVVRGVGEIEKRLGFFGSLSWLPLFLRMSHFYRNLWSVAHTARSAQPSRYAQTNPKALSFKELRNSNSHSQKTLTFSLTTK